MGKGKCTNRFPEECIKGTNTNIDDYPLYGSRDTDNGGQSYKLHMSNSGTVNIDNW